MFSRGTMILAHQQPPLLLCRHSLKHGAQRQLKLGPQHGPRFLGWSLTTSHFSHPGVSSSISLHDAQAAPLLLLPHLSTTSLRTVMTLAVAWPHGPGRALADMFHHVWCGVKQAPMAHLCCGPQGRSVGVMVVCRSLSTVVVGSALCVYGAERRSVDIFHHA